MIDGCAMRKELAEQILEKREELEELKKTVEQVSSELGGLLQTDNELIGVQYCDLSTPIYKVIDGIVQKDENGNPIIERYTHDEYCPHKEI